MSFSSRPLLLAALATGITLGAGMAGHAADRAGYLSVCEKERGAEAKAKCACVADGIDKTFKDKKLSFAYDSVSKPIGELAQGDSGLTEKEEDDIVDQTYAVMKGCGLAP